MLHWHGFIVSVLHIDAGMEKSTLGKCRVSLPVNVVHHASINWVTLVGVYSVEGGSSPMAQNGDTTHRCILYYWLYLHQIRRNSNTAFSLQLNLHCKNNSCLVICSVYNCCPMLRHCHLGFTCTYAVTRNPITEIYNVFMMKSNRFHQSREYSCTPSSHSCFISAQM